MGFDISILNSDFVLCRKCITLFNYNSFPESVTMIVLDSEGDELVYISLWGVDLHSSLWWFDAHGHPVFG